MPNLLCSEADVRQRVGSWVIASLSADLANGSAYLVGEEDDPTNGAGLITRWSTQFEGEVGYAIGMRTQTITVDGSGTNELIIERRYTPILAIHSIDYADIGGQVTSYGFEADSGQIFLTEEPTAYVTPRASFGRTRLNLPVWPFGRDNISITLRYGHEVVPPEVRKAVADRVAADVLLEDRARRDRGLRSKQLGDRSESYGAGRWADEIAQYVQQYELWVRRLTSEVQVGA
jgi:hypothetical protein